MTYEEYHRARLTPDYPLIMETTTTLLKTFKYPYRTDGRDKLEVVDRIGNMGQTYWIPCPTNYQELLIFIAARQTIIELFH